MNYYNCSEAVKLYRIIMFGKLASQSKVSPEGIAISTISVQSEAWGLKNKTAISDGSRSIEPQEKISGQQIQVYNRVKRPKEGIIFFVVQLFVWKATFIWSIFKLFYLQLFISDKDNDNKFNTKRDEENGSKVEPDENNWMKSFFHHLELE